MNSDPASGHRGLDGSIAHAAPVQVRRSLPACGVRHHLILGLGQGCPL